MTLVTLSGAASSEDLMADFHALDDFLLEEGLGLLEGDSARVEASRASQLGILERNPQVSSALGGSSRFMHSSRPPANRPCLSVLGDTLEDNRAIDVIFKLGDALAQKRKEDACYFETSMAFNAYLQRYALFQRISQKLYADRIYQEVLELRARQDTLQKAMESQARLSNILVGITLGISMFTAIFLAFYR